MSAKPPRRCLLDGCDAAVPEPGRQGGRRQLYCSQSHRELAHRRRSIDRQVERIVSAKLAELDARMAAAEDDLRERLTQALLLVRRLATQCHGVASKEARFWKLHRSALTPRAAALVPELVKDQERLENFIDEAAERMEALFGIPNAWPGAGSPQIGAPTAQPPTASRPPPR